MRAVGADLLAGDRVGVYRIVRRIAPSYYDAENITNGKRITVEVGDRDDSRLVDVRFIRSQAILGPLRHPSLARILDQGSLYDKRPWIAAQRPHGAALSELFLQGRLTRDETCAVVRGVASVLAYAHAHAVVHGNLRPHQIIITDDAPDAPVPVSVSGWAQLRAPGLPAFSDPPAISVYVAPEHMHGPIDGRADLYTLGAIAYRGLTGVFPDVARDLIDRDDPLGEIVNAMLAKDPRQRPSAEEVCATLTLDSPTARHEPAKRSAR
ncbi:hypothetical protein BH11MYX1_BH11MYX1_30230 [soil metagenome]